MVNRMFLVALFSITGCRPMAEIDPTVTDANTPDAELAPELMPCAQLGFPSVPSPPTGPGPRSIAAADLNGDGTVDIAVASFDSSKVSVLLGTGNGMFLPKIDYDTGSSPIAVAVADVNGDSKLDLVLANSAASTVSVLLGNGDGTFRAHIDFGTGTTPRSAAVADVSGDGKLDIITANSATNTLSVLLGNGDGVQS